MTFDVQNDDNKQICRSIGDRQLLYTYDAHDEANSYVCKYRLRFLYD